MVDPIEKLFSQHGLRCTRQRRTLYQALAASREHPTADELFRQVCHEAPRMSLATVYNTLEAFCHADLARKLPGTGANGSARYDAVRDEHLHVQCQRTGTVADVPIDLSRRILERIPPKLLRQVESQLSFKISQVQIELVGEFQPPPTAQSPASQAD